MSLGSGAPLVAVSMATYNPEPGLLARQVESLRAQTLDRWICIVSDDASEPEALAALERVVKGDERFRVSRNAERLGVYRNFERALRLVPEDVAYVAFCDQDDVWHPEKLDMLVAALEGSGALLAYSDMNIVTPDGALIAPSYWTHRRNNHTDLGSLLLVNTVTGAASLFRRDLLDVGLPFPPEVGQVFHDHWIACVALALGEIVFVERPLHDYVQHGGNVVGRHEPAAGDFRGGLVNALRRFVASPRRRARNTLRNAPGHYADSVVPRQLFARTLEERVAGRVTADKRRAVRRVARMDSSATSLLWLLGRSARDVRGTSPTLGIENQLIKGVLWRWRRSARLAR